MKNLTRFMHTRTWYHHLWHIIELLNRDFTLNIRMLSNMADNYHDKVM